MENGYKNSDTLCPNHSTELAFRVRTCNCVVPTSLKQFSAHLKMEGNNLRQIIRFLVQCDRSLGFLLPMIEFVNENSEHNRKLFEFIIKYASNSLIACLYYVGFFDDDPYILSYVCGVVSIRYQVHEDERDLITRMIRENTGKCENNECQ